MGCICPRGVVALDRVELICDSTITPSDAPVGDTGGDFALALYVLERLLITSQQTPTIAVPVVPHALRVSSGERGFSIAFFDALHALYSRHGALELSIVDICRVATHVNVCALTSATGLSLVESCLLLAEAEALDVSGLFGTASTFFSYSWEGSSFADVYSAARRALASDHGRRDAGDRSGQRFMWLDLLCASQNLLAGRYEGAEQYPTGSPQSDARKEDTDRLFDDALRAATEITVYLAPLVGEWDAPAHPPLQPEYRGASALSRQRRKGPRATTRAWCLFELSSMLAAGGRLRVELPGRDLAQLEHILSNEGYSHSGVLATILDGIDANDAQVSKEKDREFIVRRIRAAGGFEEVNRTVKRGLREWLYSTALACLNEAEVAWRTAQASMASGDKGAGTAPYQLMSGIGELLHDMGRYAESEAFHRRAHDGLTACHSAYHPKVFDAMHGWAQVLMRLGRHAEAESLCTKALHGLEDLLGADDPQTLRAVNQLGCLRVYQGAQPAPPALPHARTSPLRMPS